MGKPFKQKFPYRVKQYLKSNHGIVISRAIMRRTSEESRIISLVDERTMTGENRILNLLNCVEYVVKAKLVGDFVECGVWRGGSILAMGHKLLQLQQGRDIWAYDTFEGTPEPTKEDFVLETGQTMSSKWSAGKIAFASRGDFEFGAKEFLETGVNIIPIQGDIRTTLKNQKPKQISILRIDTDIYEPVKFALEELWGLITDGGVLIIDDYDTWAGAKKATDEFFESLGYVPLLMRMDTGRIILKTQV
jgi:O-methyltransferase